MTQRRTRKAKPVRAWGGFMGGELQWFTAHSSFAWEYQIPAIYKTRREALQSHNDIRRIIVRELPRKRRGKT